MENKQPKSLYERIIEIMEYYTKVIHTDVFTKDDAADEVMKILIEEIGKAFDAGITLYRFHETNHPENALTKEEYINQLCNQQKTFSLEDEAISLLTEAALQIRYLGDKFTETGTGNAVATKIEQYLKQLSK